MRPREEEPQLALPRVARPRTGGALQQPSDPLVGAARERAGVAAVEAVGRGGVRAFLAGPAAHPRRAGDASEWIAHTATLRFWARRLMREPVRP